MADQHSSILGITSQSLSEYYDKDLPESIRNGQRITTMTSGQARFPVAPIGIQVSNNMANVDRGSASCLPHTAKHVDDIALITDVHTNAINHDPACTFVMTGNEVPGKPSLGSWLATAWEVKANDLPAFVVLTPNWKSKCSGTGTIQLACGAVGFLPIEIYRCHIATHVGDPVLVC